MTPKDVVRLCVGMIFANDDELMSSDTGIVRTLYDQTCVKAMLDRLSIYRYTSVRTMLDLLGLDYKEYVLALGRYGLDLDDSFLKKDFLENKDLSSFLKELLPDIIENSEEEFLSLQYYMGCSPPRAA